MSSAPTKWLNALRRFFRIWSLPKAPAGLRWIAFADGRVAFLAPAHYAMHREPDDTLAVYPPGRDSGVTLRLSLHPQALDLKLPNDAAERFVADHAAQHGLPLTRLADRVFLSRAERQSGPTGEYL